MKVRDFFHFYFYVDLTTFVSILSNLSASDDSHFMWNVYVLCSLPDCSSKKETTHSGDEKRAQPAIVDGILHK